jgi:hypothetical protein
MRTTIPEELSELPDDADVYDVTLAFDQALAEAPQDHAQLTRWTARFPQFADELIAVGYARFAFGLTLTDPVAEYVVESVPSRTPLTNLMDDAKARGLDAAGFAQELGLDKLLLGKLNRRTLEALSLPRTLVERLAQILERSFDEVAAYLNGGMRLAAGAYYKARQAPSLVAESGQPKQSFAEALQSGAQITEEDKAFWLAEIAAGRTLGEESAHE